MPPETPLAALVLLLLLQAKHALCDGPLQTSWMVQQKGYYGRTGGLVHAAIHGAGSLVAVLVFGMAALPALALALVDGVIHYHIDFAKETLVRRIGWTTHVPQFWWALQADQMIHHFTYVAVAAAVFVWF